MSDSIIGSTVNTEPTETTAPAPAAPAESNPPSAAPGTVIGGATPPTAPAPAAPEGETSQEPAEYNFTLPEGFSMDENLIGKFTELAKTSKLDPKVAQQIVDLQTATQKQQIDDFEQMKKTWHQESMQLLGTKPEEGTALVAKAAQFASPELKSFLEETGLGSHPLLVSYFREVGKHLVEDRFAPGNPRADKPRNDGELFYPNMKG